MQSLSSTVRCNASRLPSRCIIAAVLFVRTENSHAVAALEHSLGEQHRLRRQRLLQENQLANGKPQQSSLRSLLTRRERVSCSSSTITTSGNHLFAVQEQQPHPLLCPFAPQQNRSITYCTAKISHCNIKSSNRHTYTLMQGNQKIPRYIAKNHSYGYGDGLTQKSSTSACVAAALGQHVTRIVSEQRDRLLWQTAQQQHQQLLQRDHSCKNGSLSIINGSASILSPQQSLVNAATVSSYAPKKLQESPVPLVALFSTTKPPEAQEEATRKAAAASPPILENDRASYRSSNTKKEGEGIEEVKGLHSEKVSYEIPWRATLLACCACISIACAVAIQTERRKRQRTACTESDAVGKPLLGGPWTLVDMRGRLRGSEEFEGNYQLIYFGFSFCPDICPQELEKMAQVVERLDKVFGEVVQPIFITVDPQRDTVAQVNAYCGEFHPRLLGFTGTPAQIKDVTRKFRVYYNEGIRSSEEDYLVDHSIIQYFMGRNGKFRDFFGKNMTAREITDKITNHINKDRERDKKKRD